MITAACCLLRPTGEIVLLADQDGSQAYYHEPTTLDERDPSDAIRFVDASKVIYTRYRVVDHFGYDVIPPVGFVYALAQPTPEETARAFSLLTTTRETAKG
jgi:hypothetical protein